MALNPHSIVGFLLRNAGYAEQDVEKILGITQEYGPAAESVIQAVGNVIQADAAAFAAGQSVVSPAVGASIQNHAYKISVHFDPA